ncbi:MAPEG family protein [Pseudoxanthomonas suwonensis]|uniref:Membrane protein n=1 Tax=Pseudoxanthomonas suwonensis TaxID=314722 RepID=A0A0E3YZS9_9GAMM|nr:MAPEG family protein [Pseudoxanthomonas suwonensis]AKC85654.1 membrane protein [Pseudoxanthomonas suwonensis]
MGIELQFLGWVIVLGLVQLLLAAGLSTRQRGLAWNTGPRDSSPPLAGVAGRSDRAFRNFLETFPFFAAAVLAVTLAGRTGEATALGVQLYFWARVAYVPLYLGGVRYVRSLVWTLAMAGLVLVLWPLLPAA